MEEGERQFPEKYFENVPENDQKSSENIINEFRDIFPENLPKVVPPSREVQYKIDIEPGSKPSYLSSY